MLNKKKSTCLTCPSASFALQFGDFVLRGRSDAKGPLTFSQNPEYGNFTLLFYRKLRGIFLKCSNVSVAVAVVDDEAL